MAVALAPHYARRRPLRSAGPDCGSPPAGPLLRVLRHHSLVVVLAAAVVSFVVTLLLIADAHGGRRVTRTVRRAGHLRLGLAAPAAREQVRLRPVRRAAAAVVLSSSGIFGVWTYYAVRHDQLPQLPSLADGFFVTSVTLLLIGAVAWPAVTRRGDERWRFGRTTSSATRRGR